MYTLVACLALVITLWFLQGQRSAIRRNGKRLPRPPGTLPLAGNGIWFLQPRHELLDWFVRCERLVGFSTFEISVPSLPPGIVVNDPLNVEHVLKNNEIFIKGEFFRIRSWDLFGNGIINADGEMWKIQRKAGLRFFSNANLKTFIEDVLPPILADTEKSLDEASRNGNVLNLQNVLLDLTTRLMGNMAYDMDMPASLPFSKSFDFASGATGERFQNPFWKLKEFFFGAPLRKAVFDTKVFGRSIVSAATQKRQDKSASSKYDIAKNADPLQNNLINSLLDHIDDHQVVADAAMNYLSAGIDTTAQSLTWTLYLLMRHPDAQEKILSELRSTFTEARDELPLSFDKVQPSYLPYISAVFNESLRFYPPVPVELKESTADTTFPDGTWLPKGSVVIWATWAMGRSRNIWGDDADTFRPERWLIYSDEGERPTLKTMSAFAFPVFNGGPRACLGKKMAELLAAHVIACLIWKYEFAEVFDNETKPGEAPKDRQSQNSLTLPMEGGLPCYFLHLKALGEGRKDGHSGKNRAIDGKCLEEAARVKLIAGHKAVNPAIAEDIKQYEDEMISVYKPVAEGVRRFAQPLCFTRAEVAHIHKIWEANRLSWGLPLDGETDVLTPKDLVVGPLTAKMNPSTSTPAEEQTNASSTDDLSDPDYDPESSEKNVSEYAFILDGIVTTSGPKN